MARENQGLNIALIIFVLLTIVLSVTTYLFFDKAKKATAENEQVRKDKSSMEETLNKRTEIVNQFVKIIGEENIEPTDEKIQELINKHVKKFDDYIAVAGLQEKVKPNNYPQIIAAMADAVKVSNVEVVKVQEQLDAVKANLKQEQGKFANEIQVVQADKTKIEGDSRNAVQTFSTALIKEKEIAKDHEASNQKNTAKIEQAIAAVAAEKKKNQKELVTRDDIIRDQRKEIKKYDDPRPTLTDGRIIAVDEYTKTATIDIGSDASLQRRITFSVYDKSTNDVGNAIKKGSIEVIEILDRGMARARILENSITDPILPGDFIDSLLWFPGKKQKFAIAGIIDFDNDGISDRATLIDFIVANGGTIVSDVNERGEVNGAVTADTAQLVLGKTTDTILKDPKFQKGWERSIADAKRFGVESIPLAKFLEKIGYTAAPDVGTNPGSQRLIDTTNRNLEGQDKLVNPFRQRVPPPTPGKNSAF
jgi:hypothetical protein